MALPARRDLAAPGGFSENVTTWMVGAAPADMTKPEQSALDGRNTLLYAADASSRSVGVVRVPGGALSLDPQNSCTGDLGLI